MKSEAYEVTTPVAPEHVAENATYRIYLWHCHQDAWSHDAYALRDVENALDAITWAAAQAEIRKAGGFEVFLESEDLGPTQFLEPRDVRLFRIYGAPPAASCGRGNGEFFPQWRSSDLQSRDMNS